jgi:hypothetical protein
MMEKCQSAESLVITRDYAVQGTLPISNISFQSTGGPQDNGGSIMVGWCDYNYLSPDVATGWDIAAISDKNYDYAGTASCGVCYEIECLPMDPLM